MLNRWREWRRQGHIFVLIQLSHIYLSLACSPVCDSSGKDHRQHSAGNLPPSVHVCGNRSSVIQGRHLQSVVHAQMHLWVSLEQRPLTVLTVTLLYVYGTRCVDRQSATARLLEVGTPRPRPIINTCMSCCVSVPLPCSCRSVPFLQSAMLCAV